MKTEISHLISVILAVQLLFGIAAEAELALTASENKDTYNDLIEITQGNIQESTGMQDDNYNDIERRTIAMILNTALSMNNQNLYRIVLESIYGGTDGSVENVMENAKSIWRALGSIIVAQNTMTETGEGNNKVYQDADSVNNIVYALKQVLGDRAGNLSSGMTVEELWAELCKMSQQDFGEDGGEFSWEETVPGGGSKNVAIGDQVFFAITAHMGAKSVHSSYSDPYKIYVNGNKKGTEEVLPRVYKNPDNPIIITVTPGSSITLEWCGMVVGNDVNTGLVRAICGNIDLTGLGAVGNTKHYDANGNEVGSLSAEPVEGSKGTMKLKASGSDDPDWYITITTKFCHNKVDYNSLKSAYYSSIVLDDGTMLDIDPDDENLIKYLMDNGGLAEDEAILVASKVRLLKIYTDMTFSGIPQSEALAWLSALQYATKDSDADGFSADTLLNSFGDKYKEKYESWRKNKSLEKNTISSITDFLIDALNNDPILSEQVNIVSNANVNEHPEDQRYQDLSNIFTFFFGYSDTINLAMDEIDGRKFYDRNSIEGQIWKFIRDLTNGVIDMDYYVPNGGDGAVGNGTPGFINDLRGPSNDDVSIPTAIKIFRQYDWNDMDLEGDSSAW